MQKNINVKFEPISSANHFYKGKEKELANSLENYIKDKYKDVFFGNPVLTRTRHRSALKNCLRNLKKIKKNKEPELNAEDLRLSLNSLESIIGKYNIEKLLDIVFKDFCIGK